MFSSLGKGLQGSVLSSRETLEDKVKMFILTRISPGKDCQKLSTIRVTKWKF
jgi:hypothetical protein